MRDGAFWLIAFGAFLYVASCLMVATESVAFSPANPAEVRRIATTETPGLMRAVGSLQHLAAASSAASQSAFIGTPGCGTP